MYYSFCLLVLIFFLYAFVGYLCEIISVSQKTHHFTLSRGYLIGPYLPVFGMGAILMITLLQQYSDDVIVLFVMSLTICCLLEYFTSLIMEKIFKARWWDYKKRKFNINGRVCLETIIPFGLLSCMILYGTNPLFIDLLERMSEDALQISFITCLIIFVTDFIISFTVISRLRKTVKQVNKNETVDNTEEITNKVKEILLGSKSALDRRLIKAFPKISIEDVKKRIIETTNQVKESVAKVTETAAEHIKESAAQVKESTMKVKDEVADRIKESTEKFKNKD